MEKRCVCRGQQQAQPESCLYLIMKERGMKCIFIDYFMEGDFLSRNLLLFKTQPYINDRIFFTIVKSFRF